MQEILPGLFHWTAIHPRIGIEVSSYYLSSEGVLLDPLAPAEGVEWFADHGSPATILLTNRHHWRHSDRFVEAYGCEVRVSRAGMHEFSGDRPVTLFDFGDELPGGIVAYEVGAICPDETALHLPSQGALAVADGVMHYDAQLEFVPDEYMGEPEDLPEVKAGLCRAYDRLLALEFDHLLLAHGAPAIGGAKDALRAFVGGGA